MTLGDDIIFRHEKDNLDVINEKVKYFLVTREDRVGMNWIHENVFSNFAS